MLVFTIAAAVTLIASSVNAATTIRHWGERAPLLMWMAPSIALLAYNVLGACVALCGLGVLPVTWYARVAAAPVLLVAGGSALLKLIVTAGFARMAFQDRELLAALGLEVLALLVNVAIVAACVKVLFLM